MWLPDVTWSCLQISVKLLPWPDPVLCVLKAGNPDSMTLRSKDLTSVALSRQVCDWRLSLVTNQTWSNLLMKPSLIICHRVKTFKVFGYAEVQSGRMPVDFFWVISFLFFISQPWLLIRALPFSYIMIGNSWPQVFCLTQMLCFSRILSTWLYTLRIVLIRLSLCFKSINQCIIKPLLLSILKLA